MAEFQDLLDFPPAPKLNVLGQARPGEGERSGAARPGAVLRQGAVRDLPPGAVLHRQPDAQPAGRAVLQAEARSTAAWPSADGPIKTFPLRGIKDSPPYLHDGRLLTLEDTVEFFNLVLGLKLLPQEKRDLVAFPPSSVMSSGASRVSRDGDGHCSRRVLRVAIQALER